MSTERIENLIPKEDADELTERSQISWQEEIANFPSQNLTEQDQELISILKIMLLTKIKSKEKDPILEKRLARAKQAIRHMLET